MVLRCLLNRYSGILLHPFDELCFWNQQPTSRLQNREAFFVHELVGGGRCDAQHFMLTTGTTENEMLRRWRGMYNRMADDLQRFRYDTDDMLTDYFEEMPSRRPEAYASAFEESMASSGKSICRLRTTRILRT